MQNDRLGHTVSTKQSINWSEFIVLRYPTKHAWISLTKLFALLKPCGLAGRFAYNKHNMCQKISLMLMGGWAEGLACADPEARTPISLSWISCLLRLTGLIYISRQAVFPGTLRGWDLVHAILIWSYWFNETTFFQHRQSENWQKIWMKYGQILTILHE